MRGLEASARVLEAGIRAATLDEAEPFAIAPGAELFELHRVRMLDGVPISLDHNRVPLRLAPDLTDLDFATPRCTKCSTRRQRAAARGL